jgi:hypothetical protein
MAETKTKPSSSLRTPKPKKLGLVVPPALRLPHEALIKPETVGEVESMTSHTSLTDKRETLTSAPPEEVPVSPVRDYTKVANSIRREAVPAGLFKGKSKQLYDELYALTRGAVVPKRQVRISRPKLMKLAHIGSRVTFDTNVNHLRAVGLIEVTVVTGEHEGNEYEVFIPEELEGQLSIPSQTSQTSLTRYAQKLDRLVRLETSQTRHTSSVVDTDSYAGSKTSFKTNREKTDDEAFAKFLDALRTASRELTGKESSASDSEKWAELAELLVTELKIAAGRTEGVSSVPAFLTEHLRRRLWKREKRQVEAEATESRQEQRVKVDASKCPDCFGTGMYYPEGFEKGVARCTHDRLVKPVEASQ